MTVKYSRILLNVCIRSNISMYEGGAFVANFGVFISRNSTFRILSSLCLFILYFVEIDYGS